MPFATRASGSSGRTRDMAAELDRRTSKLMTRALVFATIANSVLTGILAIVAIANLLH